MNQQSEGLFDFDGAKDDVNRRAIAIGFALIVFSGFVDWQEMEMTWSYNDGWDDYEETTDATLKGPMDDDTRDAYEHAGYLWYLGIIGLGAVLVRRSKLEEQIGDENYGNFFLGFGILCLLLAYSVYSEISEDTEDAEDLSSSSDYGDMDVDVSYKMGYYMALIGPIAVLYGGYNIYNDMKNGP
tara:strand:+ start:805 stop:1356 length:552 start_codon:yes stop_codon:yes gene_type:complete